MMLPPSCDSEVSWLTVSAVLMTGCGGLQKGPTGRSGIAVGSGKWWSPAPPLDGGMLGAQPRGHSVHTQASRRVRASLILCSGSFLSLPGSSEGPCLVGLTWTRTRLCPPGSLPRCLFTTCSTSSICTRWRGTRAWARASASLQLHAQGDGVRDAAGPAGAG